jgi:O-antigen ligase
MGLFFTIVYLIVAYLAPVTLFGDLAQYHIETYIVSLALIFSLFAASGSGVLKLTQTWAIFGLCGAVALSIMANGWIGGGPKALLEFVPEVTSFFLIVMTCKKKWHLQALALTLFFCATFIIGRAIFDISSGHTQSPYLLYQHVSENSDDYFIRIRGLSFLSDPNDFAQFLVSLIPMMFLFWSRGATIRNFLLVYAPCAFLFYAMYLAHSRGSMVALMALCMVAGRRKIGVVPSIVIGVVVFAGLTALGFSGGRDVSAGDDRVAAWATGLMLIRAHSIFGVGFNKFSDFNEITAHNTFVVCAAELGLVGVLCWVLLIFVTVRNVVVANKDPDQDAKDLQKKLDAVHSRQPFLHGIPTLAEAALAPATAAATAPVAAQSHPFSAVGAPFILPAAMAGGGPAGNGLTEPGHPEDEADKGAQDAEVRRMAGLMVMSFAGFLTAGMVPVARLHHVHLRECRHGRCNLQDGARSRNRTAAASLWPRTEALCRNCRGAVRDRVAHCPRRPLHAPLAQAASPQAATVPTLALAAVVV